MEEKERKNIYECGCGHNHEEHIHEHHDHEENDNCGHNHEEHAHGHHCECGCGHAHDHTHTHHDHDHAHEALESPNPPAMPPGVPKRIYILNNLGCANCAAKMERQIRELSGVKMATITFATKQIRFKISINLSVY